MAFNPVPGSGNTHKGLRVTGEQLAAISGDVVPIARPKIPLTAELLEGFSETFLKAGFDGSFPTPNFHREMWTDCAGDHRFVAFAAPRGHAKCLAADTLIAMADGTRKRIADIAVGDKIISLNESSLQFEADQVSRKWHSGTKPVVAMRTRSGRNITLTPEHKVLTFDGWKAAGELTLDDRIASPRTLPQFSHDESYSDAEVKFLAYLITEGGLTGGSVNFTNADPEVVEDFFVCGQELGYAVVPQTRQNPACITYRANGGAPFAKAAGIWKKTSLEKRLPEWTFKLPLRQKWLFIEAVMVTDGWFAVEAGNGGVTLANDLLIDDIRHIFTQVGVVTSKTYRPNDHAGAWALQFGVAGVRKVLENCGLKQKRASAEIIAKIDGYSLTDIYPNRVKKFRRNVEREYRAARVARVDNQYDITREKLQRMIAFEPLPEWTRLEGAQVFWDRITAIEDAGVAETFDLEVATNHNLVTDGLVSHNSTSVTHAYTLCAALFRQRDFIVILSDTWGQAVEFVGDLKAEIFGNEELIKAFEIRKAVREAEDNLIVQMRDGYQFRIVARGAEQKVRGLKWRGKRPNLIVLDDVEGDEQVESKPRRDKFFKWLMKAVIPCGSDDCLYRWVGTILHFDSALERIMKDPAWKTRRYAAHASYDDFSKILWPEKFSEARLRKIRQQFINQGEADGYSQEYLNYPIAEGDAYFRPEDLLAISNLPDKKPPPNLVYYASWDFAVSTLQKSDYSCGIAVGVDSTGRMYVVDVRRGRWDALQLVEEMFLLQEAYTPALTFVEGGVIEKSIGPFLSVEMGKRQKFINLVAIAPTKDKPTRARNWQAKTKAHYVYYDKDASWWPVVEEEMRRFPKGGHDDTIDPQSLLGLGLEDVSVGKSDAEVEDEEYAQLGSQLVGACPTTGY